MTHARQAHPAPQPLATFCRCGLRLCLALLMAAAGLPPAFAAEGAVPTLKLEQPVARLDDPGPSAAAPTPVTGPRFRRARFGSERATLDARAIADWVVDSGDSHGMPFAIVDKKGAKVFVFNADGQLRGAAPALLGLALGDEAVPGIGQRRLATIRPFERTTPAGRFVAVVGHNLLGKEILWVDYEGAVSMHPVITSNARERRLERLDSPTPLDNRISYGCINVPPTFFTNVLLPAFSGTNGIVYVLPETATSQQVFGSYVITD